MPHRKSIRARLRAPHDGSPAVSGRYFDPREKLFVVTVPAESYYVTEENEIISTSLGSCVAVCVRDVQLQMGGLNHFMLPSEPAGRGSGEALRYGCYSVERLINELVKRGATRRALQVKVFGGGEMGASNEAIGRSNITFVHEYFEEERIPIEAEDVGGNWARHIRYYPTSGRVRVRRMRMRPELLRQEREIYQKTSIRPGAVELFGVDE